MKKWRYSIGLKAAAAAASQILAVIFVICLMILVVLFQKNILNFLNLVILFSTSFILLLKFIYSLNIDTT